MRKKAKVQLKLLITLVVVIAFISVVFLTNTKQTDVKSASWYNNDWGARKLITISNTLVDDDLANFPVYVNLADLGSDFFGSVKSDGSDIVITSDDGVTKLSRELVTINKAGQTGELWFKAPVLSDTLDTEFYIYYGNATGTETNTTAVWSNGYVMVQHMDEDPTAIAPQILDSTSNSINGTANGMVGGDLIDAKLGKGLVFDGTNNYISLGAQSGLNIVTNTISFWINFRNTGTWIYNGNNGAGDTRNGVAISTTRTMTVDQFLPSGGSNFTTNQLANQSWTYVTVEFNGTTDRIFFDGNLVHSEAAETYSGAAVANWLIGTRLNPAASNYYLDSYLDEFRVSNTTRSTGWISTEYNNQNSPGTFYSVDPEEVQTVAAWYDTNWPNRIKITVYASQVAENVTDFPVFVDMDNFEISFYSLVKSDGSDIVITSMDGQTVLSRELVALDKAATTGEIWFKAPSLSSTVDNEFYLYFGNPSANQSNSPDAVWSNNFEFVEHFNEDPSGSAPQLNNSLTTGLNGTSNGTMTSDDLIDSWLGTGIEFDGFDDRINYGAYTVDDTLYTAGLFYKFNSGVAVHRGNSGWCWYNPHMALGTSENGCSGGGTMSSGLPNDGEWHYLAITRNGANAQTFGDGQPAGSRTTIAAPISTSSSQFNVGAQWNSASGYAGYFNGIADHLRISSVVRSNGWIETEYNNMYSPTTFYNLSSIESLADWYSDSWAFRIRLTIPAASVFEDVVDFPVYVDLSNLGADFFEESKSDGSDIIVTAYDGITKLSRELVYYDQGLEEGELWFKALALSSTTDNEFYIYFGNGTGSETNMADVWSNGYEMVQHLEETTAGDTDFTDSSTNVNDSVTVIIDGAGSDPDAIGQLDGAVQFDGVNDTINMADNASLSPTGNMTLSLWVNLDVLSSTLTHPQNLIVKADATNAFAYQMGVGTNDNPYFQIKNGSATQYTAGFYDGDLVAGNWAYLTGVHESNVLKFYQNGSTTFQYTANTTGSILDGNGVLRAGSSSPGFEFDGRLDEIRISSVARSLGWTQTEYLNQSAPLSFYTLDLVDTDRIFKVHQDNDIPNEVGDILVCMQGLEQITNDSLLTISYSSQYSITGGGTLTEDDYTAYCDNDGEEGGNQTEMINVSISSQGEGTIVFDTGIDTCNQWMCINFTGGTQRFQNPVASGNYEWQGYLDIDGNSSIEQSQNILSFIGDANEIGVSGYIPPLIALDIYEPNSETRTNSCELGVLQINLISQCVYDIGTSINAQTGVSLYMTSDGGLIDDDGNEIDACTSTGCDAKGGVGVSYAEEEYGFYVSETGSGEYSVAGFYDTQHQPVPQSFTLIATSNSTGSGTASGSFAQRLEFTHAASIDVATMEGNYSQILTFRLYSN